MNASLTHPTWPTHRFRAMGSQIQFWLDADSRLAQLAFTRAEAYVQAAERRLTRFDPDSELSRLNAQPEEWVTVSPLLWDVATQALHFAEATAGDFDPTLLSAMHAVGYTHSFSCTTEMSPSFATGAAAPGRYHEVQLDPDRRAIWLPAGVGLDFGGIGKGYIATHALSLLSETGPALVDAGGDVIAGDAPMGFPGWPVSIAEGDSGDLCLWLVSQGVATSGKDFRRWFGADGQLRHHIIDPHTGLPSLSNLVTATVLAPTVVQAEVWAKVALVNGRERGLALLHTQQLSAALTDEDGVLWLTPNFESYLSIWPTTPNALA